ncbi:hypothetical protein BRD00_07035 [Halobacteriales archaeon QS_8_69_26]|nr:MAG: hypothetical protein BRD00_07035 [Halobacteriales archaeon QS_8_69_26]
MDATADEGDWPHDPDGEEGSEEGRKYGMAIVAKKVEDVTFPLSRAEFVEEHGDDPVRLNHRRVVSVADVFEYVDREEFDDLVEFHRAVGDAMREGGFWEYTPDA